MAAEPGPPSTPSEPAAGDAPSAPVPVEPVARCGPLSVTRYVKADGRALILYARAEDPAP